MGRIVAVYRLATPADRTWSSSLYHHGYSDSLLGQEYAQIFALARGGVATAIGLLSGCAATVHIDGAVDRPAAYTLTREIPITQTVNFSSGSGAQTHTYTGANLWTVLNHAGLQIDASKKSDLLNRYVLATGADGYKTVFALGELHPEFGNMQSLVAYAETRNGVSVPLAAVDGPFRVTAPGDIKGGRYVSQLTRLEVRSSGSSAAGTSGGVSPSFTVSGAVSHSMTFDAAALRALTASSLAVGANTYTGVNLFTLLKTVVGVTADASVHNATLGMYVVATGSDGYKAVLSLGEIDPGFGNRAALVAYRVNGADLGRSGAARLIVPGDTKMGRSVSNLVAIEVFTAP
jgi:hypothetical protein